MLRALTKVIYSVLESKFGTPAPKQEAGKGASGEKKGGKKGVKNNKDGSSGKKETSSERKRN
jgi:hypothetical protein